jgi:polysaccharide lyase-like protein
MKIPRSMSAGNKKALLLSLVVTAVLSLFPISSHATVDWTEGFEYADDTAFGAVWSASCLGNPGISTDRAFSGSKSVKLVFNGTVGVDPGAGGCYMDRYLPALSDTLFTRIYIYLENFTANSTGTKMLFAGQNGAYPNFWWEQNGGPNLNMIISSTTPDGQNVYGGALPQNQWACIETRITMNTPGAANGIVQSWVNGTQQINRSDLLLRGATLTQQNGPNSQLEFLRIYVQHGWGTMYYDDYAVSRDARIGCSGSPAPTGNTTPPAPPTGLVVR